MDNLKIVYKNFRHLVLYGIIGTLSAALDFLIYTLLVQIAEIPYILANCCSVMAGITCSFCLNRSYNFKVKDRVKSRFAIFVTVGICGLMLSNLILYECVEVLAFSKMVSKVLSIVLVVFFQFLVNKMLTFRPLEK